MGTYLQIPQVPNLAAIIISRDLIFIVLLDFAIDLKFEPTLIGQMEQADKAEAGADLVHLVLRVRLLQTGDDRRERSSLRGICRLLLICVLLNHESADQQHSTRKIAR